MDEKLNEDFPIDWEQDKYVSRREFCKFVTLASGGLALGSTALATWPKPRSEQPQTEPVRIASVSDAESKRSVQFRFPGPSDLCLLVCPEPGVFKAYSQRCTHLSCPVQYDQRSNKLVCPCHNGAFSVQDGRPTQGPPQRPLPEIEIEVRGGDVFAVGMRGEA